MVDDDHSLRRVIEFSLKKAGYETTAVETGEKALEILEKSDFDLLISDIKLPGMDGLAVLENARRIDPGLPVIFITAFGTIEKAVETIKLGAYDYITKPFDTAEFLHIVERTLEHHRLKADNVRLRAELESRYSFSNIIGSSKPMQEVFSTVRKVANTDATVLITGESGTGKELIARAIHHTSDRSANPLVTVNCAAIPRELLESELFGHVAGAFTGAVKDKMGKFMIADGGTIFLDEIGDMNLELQAKLLRVLEDRLIEPIGSVKSHSVDIRVLAATNTDLQTKVRDAEFREDLYYRLNVIPIRIPPLRERPDDIPLLVDFFLGKFGDHDMPVIEKKALEKLLAYRWPGNVRELENLIKRLVILRKGRTIRRSDLPPELLGHRSGDRYDRELDGGDVSLEESEKKLIVDALIRSDWNQSRAARRLGIPRHILLYRMKKYDIGRRDERADGFPS